MPVGVEDRHAALLALGDRFVCHVALLDRWDELAF
jgi:hypothetical protein